MNSNKIRNETCGLTVAMIGSKGLSVCHSGLEAHVRELAGQLGLLGNRVTVYGWHNHRFDLMPQECLPKMGVENREGFWLKGKLTATISNSVWATVGAIRSRRFDIFHYHGIGCVFGLITARRQGFPTVLTLHSTNWQEKKWSRISQRLIHWLERIAIRNADAVIAVSEALASRVQKEYGVSAHIIPNGVSSMGEPSRDDEILRSLSLERGRYLLFVGRLVSDKGCHVLVEAFKKADIPLKLVLAGPHQDMSYVRSLLADAPSSTCAPGSLGQRELGALYRCCWAFCSASFVEGQSRAVLEAMTHGAACLVSDIPGHQELVTDANMRFPANDVTCLRDKLVGLYHRGKPTADCDDSRWLERHSEYSVENMAKQVMDIYVCLRPDAMSYEEPLTPTDYRTEKCGAVLSECGGSHRIKVKQDKA